MGCFSPFSVQDHHATRSRVGRLVPHQLQLLPHSLFFFFFVFFSFMMMSINKLESAPPSLFPVVVVPRDAAGDAPLIA